MNWNITETIVTPGQWAVFPKNHSLHQLHKVHNTLIKHHYHHQNSCFHQPGSNSQAQEMYNRGLIAGDLSDGRIDNPYAQGLIDSRPDYAGFADGLAANGYQNDNRSHNPRRPACLGRAPNNGRPVFMGPAPMMGYGSDYQSYEPYSYHDPFGSRASGFYNSEPDRDVKHMRKIGMGMNLVSQGLNFFAGIFGGREY